MHTLSIDFTENSFGTVSIDDIPIKNVTAIELRAEAGKPLKVKIEMLATVDGCFVIKDEDVVRRLVEFGGPEVEGSGNGAA